MNASASISLVSWIVFVAPYACAEYVATGNLEGWVCKGFGIEICSYKPIKNTLTPEGLRVLPKQFPDARVSEYNRNTGRCFVDTKGISFVTFTDEVIKPDHVGFSCVKR